MKRFAPVLAAALLFAGFLAPAQAESTTPTLSGVKAAASESTKEVQPEQPTALDYLQRLEKKNENVESMVGSFVQTKISEMFRERHTYQGRFYYLKPNRFRIDYTGKDGKKDEETVLLLENEMWNYVPIIEQAVRYDLRGETGEQREINQFLLGFGVQAQKALEYFDVSLGKRDSSGGTFTLLFTAKDPDETMQFTRATLTFDRETLRPKTIVLEDALGDQSEISMGDVEFNAKVKESRFDPDWPKGTEIVKQ
jgi:outer membrane lipoprotein-sorting protein